MNALIKEATEFIVAANGGRLGTYVSVISTHLEPLDGEADYVLAFLGNGKELTVRWSGENDGPIFAMATDSESRGVGITRNETKLSKSDLGALVDLAENAYRDWVAEETEPSNPFEEKS